MMDCGTKYCILGKNNCNKEIRKEKSEWIPRLKFSLENRHENEFICTYLILEFRGAILLFLIPVLHKQILVYI